MDAILDFHGITKSFFGVPVLEDLTLSVGEGRVLGIVGENGAGKSTLMNILGGIFPPDGGRMRLSSEPYAPADPMEAARRGVAFIHQELNLFPNLSVAENLCLAGFPKVAALPWIDRRALRRRAEELLARVELEIPPETLVEDLSQGERQLLEVAKALGHRARLIIFDEPTTSLTAREAETLFAMIERLRADGISMIYISHNLGDVVRLCDDIAVLRDGELVGTGAARGYSVDALVALMVGRRIEEIYPKRTSAPSREPMLEARGLSQRGVIEGIGLELHRGELLGIFGLMGSGRTELARILFGIDPCARGEVRIGGRSLSPRTPGESVRRGIAYVPESRRDEGLLMEAPVDENIALVSLRRFTRALPGLLSRRRLEEGVRSAGMRLGIRGARGGRQAVKTLSGGNQQKVVLARWLLERPSVFLLDEPTRGIDVGARHEIYRILDGLAAEGAGILFISSEIEELLGMCDRILVMRRGEIVEEVRREAFERERILRAALG